MKTSRFPLRAEPSTKAGVSRVALLALAGCVLSACAGPVPGVRGTSLNATEKMMWSTYPLATRKGMGTGFVIARRDSRPPVLVTSTHVLETIGRGPLLVGARVPNANGESPDIVLIQFQPQPGNERFFVRHPRLDLAAFVLNLPPDVAASANVPTFLNERSIATRSSALRTGAEVSFLGFPDVLPGTAGAFPVLRTGRVASYPVGTAGAKGLFVINADVYPGDSGAPVFANGRGGHPKLVGMIIRRVGLERRAFSHLAIAVEASAISETLQLLAAREKEPTPPVRVGGQDRPLIRQGLRSGESPGR
jgi:hypothetical protein